MRVGIIGLGSIGKRHAANAMALGHDVYFFDPDVESQFDIVKCSHLDMMVENDAVLICTPATTHASVALELLALGYQGPLFCEKPLALSAAECEVFRQWPSPVTMVGYMLRFHPLVRVMRQMKPESLRLIVKCDMRSWPGTAYAPAIFELSHEIDLAFFLGAKRASASPYGCPSIVVNTDLGPVELDGYWGEYDRKWMVSTQVGSVQASFNQPQLLGDKIYVDELAHFLACVESNTPTITPFSDGIRVVGVCEQAMKLAGATV